MDRKSVIKKIDALMNKTVENGCSEAEALAAAKMMNKLMEQHNLGLSDISIKETKSVASNVKMGFLRMPRWLSDLAAFTAWHYDAELIYNRTTLTFFGDPVDVEASQKLFNVLQMAVKFECAEYTRNEDYRFHRRSSSARVLTNSFKIGMVYRLGYRLNELKRERDANIEGATGTSLVLLKKEKVEADKAIAFPRLKEETKSMAELDYSAARAGENAGDAFCFNDQLGNN